MGRHCDDNMDIKKQMQVFDGGGDRGGTRELWQKPLEEGSRGNKHNSHVAIKSGNLTKNNLFGFIKRVDKCWITTVKADVELPPFTVVIQHLSNRLIKPNFCFDLPHRRSTTVSLETRNPRTTWPVLYSHWWTGTSICKLKRLSQDLHMKRSLCFSLYSLLHPVKLFGNRVHCWKVNSFGIIVTHTTTTINH